MAQSRGGRTNSTLEVLGALRGGDLALDRLLVSSYLVATH